MYRPVLRGSIALIGGLAEPGERLCIVLRRALAVVVHDAQPVLRIGISALSSRLELRQCGGIFMQPGGLCQSECLVRCHGLCWKVNAT